MASQLPLKRKRAAVEVLNTPKRPKPAGNQSANPLQILAEPQGLESALNPVTRRRIRGPEGSASTPKTKGKSASLFENVGDGTAQNDKARESAMIKENGGTTEKSLEKHRKRKKTSKKGKSASGRAKLEAWKLSKPIGGRMINVDPVLSIDEKFMIVATRTTIHVYSASTSLLTRSIPLKLKGSIESSPHIITLCLSPTVTDLLWVACSDGSVFNIDWTTGAGADQSWGASSLGCIHMTVASMESDNRRRDVVFTTEERKNGGFRITAHELARPNDGFKTVARTIYSTEQRIPILKTGSEGSIIVGASGNKILLGQLRATDYSTIDRIKYEFRVFDTGNAISSLDLRVTERTGTEGVRKKNALKKAAVVDLVIGDIRGVIYLHNDLLLKLIQSQDGTLQSGVDHTPRRLHWHRQAVQTVKFSLDGNYVISGGAETVLVLWQLDTGKQQFLPHMSAKIQNIVVSPTGSSYAIQLADNSAIILSTAELKPTTNIAGIQAPVIAAEASLESHNKRVDDVVWKDILIQRTPAVINPATPSHLLLGVGQSQEVKAQKPLVMSNPFLQTFDLSSGHNLSRQALTRTSITNVNANPNAGQLSEPRVTHMKLSHDGMWLATVDDWAPPVRDLTFLRHQENDTSIEQDRRREVYLKFWQWNKKSESWELISRIDAPHSQGKISNGACRILDLAVDPSTLRFATIGEDGQARTWTTRTRKRDGVVVKDQQNNVLRTWSCQHVISFGKPEFSDVESSGNVPATGSLAFSDDGSLLAAACSSTDGLVHFLDPDLGSIRISHCGVFEDEIFAMEFLGQDLITLSNKLSVFDVVSEYMRFSAQFSRRTLALSTAQKQEMFHLAIDARSRTFAIALPTIHKIVGKRSLAAAHSELVVFSQDSFIPQMKQPFPTLVTALLSLSSEGYLVLDSAAEIHTVLKKGTQAVTSLAQATSDMQLDTAPEEETGDLVSLIKDEDDAESGYPPTPALSQEYDSDDEIDSPVVRQQALAELFELGPAYALPPMEEMFYRVAGLFSQKPLAKSV